MQSLAARRVTIAASGLVAALALFADAANAQGSHPGAHAGGGTSQYAFMGGMEHGISLAATVFLAGLGPFAALVWLPASRVVGVGRDAVRSLAPLAWVLFCVLVLAGLAELSRYATLASGEPLSFGLLRQVLLDARVGNVWLARLGFGLLVVVGITAAARTGRTALWWATAVAGAFLLMTLTGLSHAVAEGGFLPLAADWLHVVAATLWVGGLLGFLATFFSVSLGTVPPDRRAKLREQAVRRFSRVAIGAVMVLAATGLYAILLHVPNPGAVISTPYGRALAVKLGFLVLVLGIGGANFFLRGRGPFGRLVGAELVLALGLFVATGFLTSLPPADAVARQASAGDIGVVEIPLNPTGDSVTNGTATFEERSAGLELTLEVSGLPEPGVEYFGEIHEGTCESARSDREPKPRYAATDPYAPATVRFDLLSAGDVEYAHGGAHEGTHVSLVGDADGTARVVTLLDDYATLEELLSGGPKYLDLHVPGAEDPTIACGEIG